MHDYDYKNKLFDFFIFLNRAVGSNDLIGVWGGVGGSAAKGRVAVPKRMNFQKKIQTAFNKCKKKILEKLAFKAMRKGPKSAIYFYD